MIARDKALHAIVGLAVAVLVTIATGVPAAGAIAACLAGLTKELWDATKPASHTVDPMDSVATAAPGVLLWLVLDVAREASAAGYITA